MTPADLIEPGVLLSNAIAIKNNTVRKSTTVSVAAYDITPESRWSMLFSPEDSCFYVAINGQERFRTDSPQVACAYFESRRPY